MGTQKNRLNETVLSSTSNKCLNSHIRKYLQFYAEINDSRSMLFTNFKGHVMRMLSNYAKLLAVKDSRLKSHLTPELDCYKHP